MDKNLYLTQLRESPRTDFGKREFADQRHEQQVFTAISELEGQVFNGGFRGYFGNHAETTSFAPIALRAIDAHQSAAIVEQALALVPPSLPADVDARWEIMDSLPESAADQLGVLDDQFFAYPDNLTELLFAFVAAHPEVFGPIPESMPSPATFSDLLSDPRMQDWGVKRPDSQQIRKLLDFYEADDSNDHARYLLMGLIVAALDELIQGGRADDTITQRTRRHLIANFHLHEFTIRHWVELQGSDLTDARRVTPLMREILISAENEQPKQNLPSS